LGSVGGFVEGDLHVLEGRSDEFEHVEVAVDEFVFGEGVIFEEQRQVEVLEVGRQIGLLLYSLGTSPHQTGVLTILGFDLEQAVSGVKFANTQTWLVHLGAASDVDAVEVVPLVVLLSPAIGGEGVSGRVQEVELGGLAVVVGHHVLVNLGEVGLDQLIVAEESDHVLHQGSLGVADLGGDGILKSLGCVLLQVRSHLEFEEVASGDKDVDVPLPLLIDVPLDHLGPKAASFVLLDGHLPLHGRVLEQIKVNSDFLEIPVLEHCKLIGSGRILAEVGWDDEGRD
jgi:hypothetical protein